MKDKNFCYVSWSTAQQLAHTGKDWAIYLTCHNDKQNQHKFYEVSGTGYRVTRVRNGRIGNWGTVQPQRDWAYVTETVPEKIYKKGYQEQVDVKKTPVAVPAPPPYSQIRDIKPESVNGNIQYAAYDKESAFVTLLTKEGLESLLSVNMHRVTHNGYQITAAIVQLPA